MNELDDDDEGELKVDLDLDPFQSPARAQPSVKPASPTAPPRATEATAPAAPRGPTGPTAPSMAPNKPPMRAYTPPPPMADDDDNRKWLIIIAGLVVATAVVVYWFYWDAWFPPDPADVVAQLSETENGAVQYDGEIYPSKWESDEEFSGIVQQVGRANYPDTPFVTHLVVMVTGDYADPEQVTISAIDDNQVSYAAAGKPQGDIRLLIVIPADAAALEAIGTLKPGSWANLHGDKLTGNLITPNQRGLRTVGYARVLRLRSVTFEQPEEE